MRAHIAILALVLSTSGCLRRGFGDEVDPPETPPPAPPPDRAAALEAELAGVRQELSVREAGLQDASLGHAALAQRVDELSQLNAEMADRLRSSAQGVEQLAADRARLAAALAEAQTRLDQLDRGGATPATSGAPAQPAPAAVPPPALPPTSPSADEVAAAPEP